MISENITVALGERSYDIYFGPDIYPFFQEWICRFYPGGSVFVVTDRNVSSIYLDDIKRWLSGIPHAILELPAGEESKGFDTVREIYGFLANGGAERDSLIVAFGGGVVGDLAGFAAATWLRGIPFVQVPTTLLSQVDSSVGGKTGFNLPEGKNLVGAFHQPRAVFIDHTFLRTLDDRNVLAGLAEVVKCALAGDPEMWERLVHDGPRWKEFGGADWQWLTKRAVAFKAGIVEKDEMETSLRKVLNLGHTVGHAFEQAAGYGRMLHGEAVAMGICFEAILGRRLGITPASLEESIFTLLLEMGFQLDDPEIAVTSLASAVGKDKKRSASDVVIPFVTAPGYFELEKIPLSRLRGELPGIRAEIRERITQRHRGGEGDAELVARIDRGESGAVVAELEARIANSPWDLPTLSLLAAAYRGEGNLGAAIETIKEVLARNPSDIHAQKLARDIEDAISAASGGIADADSGAAALERTLIFEEGAFELRPADGPEEASSGRATTAAITEPVDDAGIAPFCEDETDVDAAIPDEETAPDAEPEPALEPGPEPEPEPETELDEAAPNEPAIRTVTMANLYWEQGERQMAVDIIEGILADTPGDLRALEWRASHGGPPQPREGQVEGALKAFLDRITKEYPHGISRDN
ncbi:MAG TPA: 3-dehydroquinate synthase [Candidatus Deferrimicrobiaceae bacterium]